jgi:putative protein-disulfide isomerase
MATLYYVHDPMCSWCYAFEPVWGRVREAVAGRVTVKNVLGGLAPDSNVPMKEEMRHYLIGAWRRIEVVVPGTKFNYDFWEHCDPRRSTYPACRAVIAARDQGLEYEAAMTAAIQHAYYREARNPSLPMVLTEIAGAIGLDATSFAEALASDECEKRLQEELALARSLGGNGLPRLVLASERDALQIQYDYNDANVTEQFINEGIATLK